MSNYSSACAPIFPLLVNWSDVSDKVYSSPWKWKPRRNQSCLSCSRCPKSRYSYSSGRASITCSKACSNLATLFSYSSFYVAVGSRRHGHGYEVSNINTLLRTLFNQKRNRQIETNLLYKNPSKTSRNLAIWPSFWRIPMSAVSYFSFMDAIFNCAVSESRWIITELNQN